MWICRHLFITQFANLHAEQNTAASSKSLAGVIAEPLPSSWKVAPGRGINMHVKRTPRLHAGSLTQQVEPTEELIVMLFAKTARGSIEQHAA
mmetsp:Transcript_15693/g.46323  ORF Transcript_15693/g.46323 Transcript_15693/m.46323 type:complete len:92 (-) Transcript_15693:493-768(-)